MRNIAVMSTKADTEIRIRGYKTMDFLNILAKTLSLGLTFIVTEDDWKILWKHLD